MLFFVVLFRFAVYSWMGESELLFEVDDLHIVEVEVEGESKSGSKMEVDDLYVGDRGVWEEH